MNGSPWLDPLLDDIVRQIMAQVKADVSDPIGGFASHSDGVARACALLMYCVRFHGIRLRYVFSRAVLIQ